MLPRSDRLMKEAFNPRIKALSFFWLKALLSFAPRPLPCIRLAGNDKRDSLFRLYGENGPDMS